MIKLLVFISIFLAIAEAALSEQRFIEQPLDHFDAQNNETWTMVWTKKSFKS